MQVNFSKLKDNYCNKIALKFYSSAQQVQHSFVQDFRRMDKADGSYLRLLNSWQYLRISRRSKGRYMRVNIGHV